MSYTGGNVLAAATALPMTSGAMYLWSRSVNQSLATAFLAVSVISLVYSVATVSRYYHNKRKHN